jgi:sugar phosphate isomerase/epimerase
MLRDSRHIRVMSVHGIFGTAYDLSSLDPAVNGRALEEMKVAVTLAEELSAPLVVVHASAEPIAPGERSLRIARAKQALAEVAAMCQKPGIRVALELLPRTCLGNTLDELLLLLDGLDAATAGVCLDVNHMMDRYRDLPEMVHALGRRLITLHLSDYDGVDEKHLLPGQGVIDWAAFMTALRASGYRGPYNYECKLDATTVQERIGLLEHNFEWLSTL